MSKRIMICGASGTGKTTLAKHISELYNMPYINISASFVWPEFGFHNHADAHIKSATNKKVGMDYQMKIIKFRKNIICTHDHYITDRSFVDNGAYIMMELGHFLSDCETEDFFKLCSDGMNRCDGLIYLRWSPGIVLGDNKKRIKNPYFQEMIDWLIGWIMASNHVRVPCPILELNMWDFETRIQLVDKWIKKL